MEAYRLYAGTQSGMIIFRGVGDIWTSMGGSREFEPSFRNQVVDSVYGSRQNPEIVFAGVTFDGVFRTKDAGRFGHGQSCVRHRRRGTKWLQPPAIRVLWAAAEE